RNLGGSVGISFATTMLARRAQHHQAQLVAHTTNYDATFRAALAQLTALLQAHGLSAAAATKQAMARIYAAVQAQATALAYIDTLELLAIVAMVMVPAALLLKKPKPGAPVAAH
ncbi:MAG TPA: EmrB/QacA family drug resistance transporter, partial [Polyangia bacterium]|nr:EmrB/QacA family drug resistance transporter [Polyangia bacterium]